MSFTTSVFKGASNREEGSDRKEIAFFCQILEVERNFEWPCLQFEIFRVSLERIGELVDPIARHRHELLSSEEVTELLLHLPSFFAGPRLLCAKDLW